MKKISNIIYLVTLSLFIFACSKDTDLNNFSDTELINTIEFLKTQGKIDDAKIINNKIHVKYLDGVDMIFEISSSKEVKIFDKSEKQIFTTFFEKIDNKYNLSEVKTFKKNESLTYRINPDHPEGQSFCECYLSDVKEFCDSVVGCVALASPLVQAVIVAHCIVHTGTVDCPEKNK
jgi:hypothetical protein